MVTPSLKRKRHRMSAPIISMEEDEEEEDLENKKEEEQECYYSYNSNSNFPIPPSDIIHSLLLSLTSPLLSLFSVQNREEPPRGKLAPNLLYGMKLLVKRIRVGFIGAVYACVIMTMVMGVAIVVGVGLVQMWVEEPVFVRERIYFDYTQVHPLAVFDFGSGGDGNQSLKKKKGVSGGHTFYVCLVLLLPESDYNTGIGIFQVAVDLISANGHIIGRSSQPCMLRFRSLPVRLMRVFLMGIPLLLELTSETQKMTIPILKHKERVYPRTEAIRITLIPRAGTYFIPQIYEAEIVINSQLPWKKEIVRRWKWTFCVWTSMYIYVLLLLVLVCCFRQVVFPSSFGQSEEAVEEKEQVLSVEAPKETEKEKEVSESLRRWRQRRSKRKAMLMYGPSTAGVESLAASSISITREEESVSSPTAEGAGYSESVCFDSLEG